MQKTNRLIVYLRRVLKISGLIFLAWVLWSVWPALRYKSLSPIPGQPEYRYLKGSYHMHSNHSDGKGSIPDLIQAAKRADLDWIILTDHGGPNLGSERAGGWHDGVLLIGASELSSDAGHMVVIGSDTNYKLPYEPQLAIDELNYKQGLSFIAHPFDNKIPWTNWDVQHFTGIEIFSVYENVKSASWPRLLQFPLNYMINSDYAILRVLSYPQAPMNQWAKLNRERRELSAGIFATDAHGRIPITRKFDLPLPDYRSMFSSLQVYTPVPLEEFKRLNAGLATEHVLSCLKRADFFNVIESMASADGISMRFTRTDDSAENESQTSWRFILSHPFDHLLLKLFRNGEPVHEGLADNTLQLNISAEGRYRAELYLPDHPFPSLPWLVGNPVDLPPPKPVEMQSSASPAVPPIFSTLPRQAFLLEKNRESYAEIIQDESSGILVPSTILRYSLRIPEQSRDSWCSLAVRDSDILKKYIHDGDGIFIEIAGNRRCTVWLEIRATDPHSGQESWYRHSIIVDREKRALRIPFSDMTRIYGPKEKLSSVEINALFISINTSTAFIPIEGEIHVAQLGSYREPLPQPQI